MPKRQKKTELEQSNDYMAFLEKALKSKNYQKRVSAEEYEKTKQKLSKERLRRRLLQERGY